MILLRGIQARALDLLYVHGGCRYNMLSEYQTLRQAPQIYIYFYLYRSCRNRTRQGRQRRPGNIVYGPLYVNSCSIGMVSDRFCALLLLCSAARCSLLEAQPTCGESIVKSENLACDRVPLGGAMYLRSAPVVRALPPSHSAQAGSTVGARCVCRPLRWENGICRNGTGIPRNSVPFRSVPVWASGIPETFTPCCNSVFAYTAMLVFIY